jgi:hypothetical protein
MEALTSKASQGRRAIFLPLSKRSFYNSVEILSRVLSPEDFEKAREDIKKRNDKGLTFIKRQHILELQADRKSMEETLGLPLTEFSNLEDKKKKFRIHKKHISQLRLSTEQILTALGIDKTQYFNYIETGEEIEKYDKNNQRILQSDWTDVDWENIKVTLKILILKIYDIL